MIEPNSNSIGESVPVDILAEWEGPAIPALGIFFELPNIEHAGVEVDVAALAGWIAVTAISGEVGNTVHEALKKKVVGVLAACRQRFGQPKIDEVKQELFQQMEQCRLNRKISDEELKGRIERLFDEI